MKLNLHVPFKAWNGEEIKERKGEEEKAKMIDETVSLLLFSGDFIRPSSDAEMVAKQKLASYELYCKISKAKGVVELPVPEPGTRSVHHPAIHAKALQSGLSSSP